LQPRQRFHLEAADLAIVLSYFQIGVIESITDFPRGSRRSAKTGIVSSRGKYLLKQRPIHRARPERVAFAHRVQLVLLEAGFPLPRIVSTREDGKLFVRHRDHLFELFEFVAGQPFSRTPAEAGAAGDALAWFHSTLRGFSFEPTMIVPSGDFHDAAAIRVGLCGIGSTLSSHDSFSGDEAELASLIQVLLESYDQAAEAAGRWGIESQPDGVVHSDWHPGNLLFRGEKVAAVLDYDSVRRSRSITDVATGALHFSIITGDDPDAWPDHLEEELFHAFLAGYESRTPLRLEECRCLPHLMAEALIAECVPPITETGSVGRWSGFRVLKMVRRKVSWLQTHGDRLVALRKD
jgi:homoserine kinase type II